HAISVAWKSLVSPSGTRVMRPAQSDRSAAPAPSAPRARRVDYPLLVGAALVLVALLLDMRALLPAGALLSLLAAVLALGSLARRPARAHPVAVDSAARRLLADDSVRAIQRWTRTNLLTPSAPELIGVRAVHREGRIFHLEAQPALLRTGGIPTGTEVVCRDVTARAELEQLRADFLAMV